MVYSSSHSFSHEAALASLGIRQSPRGLSDTDPTLGRSHFGTIGQARAFELLLKETAAEYSKPFFDCCLIVCITKSDTCQEEYLGGTKTET